MMEARGDHALFGSVLADDRDEALDEGGLLALQIHIDANGG